METIVKANIQTKTQSHFAIIMNFLFVKIHLFQDDFPVLFGKKELLKRSLTTYLSINTY